MCHVEASVDKKVTLTHAVHSGLTLCPLLKVAYVSLPI